MIITITSIEYLRKAKLNTEYTGFLTELQMPAAAPIQQTERNAGMRDFTTENRYEIEQED